jgi:circadian clock protein KaiB
MGDTEQPSDSVKHSQHDEGIYELKLYVAGNNRKSQLAFDNLKDICNKYLEGKCRIEVIDLIKNPALARENQIVAIPTLIRKNYPDKRIVGDLSNQKKVLEVLDLRISSLIGVVNEKGSAEKTSTEESKARIVRRKRSKDDLQPYIGSGLCRQRPQDPDRYTFYLPITHVK